MNIYHQTTETKQHLEQINKDLEEIEKLSRSQKNIKGALKSLTEKIDQLTRKIISERSAPQETTVLLEELKEKINKAHASIEKGRQYSPRLFPLFNREKTWGSLEESLQRSVDQINDFLIYKQIVQHFVQLPSIPDCLAIIWEKFIDRLFGSLREKLSRALFYGYNTQQMLKEAQRFTNKQKLQQTDSCQSKDPLTCSREKLEVVATSQNLSSHTTPLESEVAQLDTEKRMGEKTRSNLRKIGGTSVKIEQKDASLDGMYLSCDNFLNSLKQKGVQLYEVQITPTQSEPFSLSGFLFSRETAESSMSEALTSLGLFSNKSEDESIGWHKLALMDGSFLLISDEQAEKLQALALIGIDERTKEWFLQEKSQVTLKFSKKELDSSSDQERGTVLLTSGNVGVYEMHKKEILSFLMRGVNVMVFNFRGYGESIGKPSQEGLKRDMEAVYQYLKAHQKVADEKLMVKALCMSGGLASHLAAKHPDVNLFIDQSYADFQSLIQDKITQEVDSLAKEYLKGDQKAIVLFKKLVKQCYQPLIYCLVKLLTPSWSVAQQIGQVKGHVGLLMTQNDEFIQIDRDIARNYSSALKHGRAKSLSLFAMPGCHGDSWLHKADLADIIKLRSSLEVDELLKNEQEAISKLPENYVLSWDSKKESRLLYEISKNETVAFQRKLTDLLQEKKRFLLQTKAVCDKESGEPFILSETKLRSIIGEALDPIQSKKMRGSLEKLIECLLIKKDTWQKYRWNVDMDEAESRIESILKRIPKKSREETKTFLEKLLSELKNGLEKGVPHEELTALLVFQTAQGQKELASNFLAQLVQPVHPFKQKYHEIVQQMRAHKREWSACDLELKIQSETKSLPLSLQPSFLKFIQKAISIDPQLLDEKIFRRKIREGRIQMDLYLKRIGFIKRQN